MQIISVLIFLGLLLFVVYEICSLVKDVRKKRSLKKDKQVNEKEVEKE